MQPDKQTINLDPELMKGRYANNLRLVFSPEEFILDFFLMSRIGDGVVEQQVDRIVVSPGHLRRIANFLNQSLEGYEKMTGESLKPAEEPGQIGFQTGDKNGNK